MQSSRCTVINLMTVCWKRLYRKGNPYNTDCGKKVRHTIITTETVNLGRLIRQKCLVRILNRTVKESVEESS